MPGMVCVPGMFNKNSAPPKKEVTGKKKKEKGEEVDKKKNPESEK